MSAKRDLRSLVAAAWRGVGAELWRHVTSIGWFLPLPRMRSDFAIGMVTYIARFERTFKPALGRLVRAFPDVAIYVAVNGFHDRDRQIEYLNEVKAFCADFSNVNLLMHVEHQPLARLWNRLILCAYPHGIIILNDDIIVTPFFRRFIECSGLLDTDVAIINSSWSHFWISQDAVRRVGWFDERLRGLGEEDGDYEARLAMKGIPLAQFATSNILHLNEKESEFSYRDTYRRHKNKYTLENREFLLQKWNVSQTPRDDGFTWVRICDAYLKLREGMETPNFYPDVVAAHRAVHSDLVHPSNVGC